MTRSLLLIAGTFMVSLVIGAGTSLLDGRASEVQDPPEVTIGERLFLETRFAEFFASFVEVGGDVNALLPSGDPVVDLTATTAAPLPGPFAGTSINCRACHLVDEQVDAPGGGMRTYADFAQRSPIPNRLDGHGTTPRNSPTLVNASLKRDGGLLLHFDGEFATLPDLVKATLTGRNYGWLPRQSDDAIAHVARVIREDDGHGELAADFGGLSYSVLLTGTDTSIPVDLKLPRAFRVDVGNASDAEIVDAVATLIGVYTEQLAFSTDERGNFNLSPFDVFLEQNGLPRKPAHGESAINYSRRLARAISSLEQAAAVQFVDVNPNTLDGSFAFHDRPFRFGVGELRGLKIFFAEPGAAAAGTEEHATGNCIACHAAPNFTDFAFHNTGVTQIEFDEVHGAEAFEQLHIPDLNARRANPDEYLPATSAHPDASGRFRAPASPGSPGHTDLGLWNVFANPDFPKPQTRIFRALCQESASACRTDALLDRAIARFKTPGLRDLGHSNPYMHNGAFHALADVIDLYRTTSVLMRSGHLRNGAPELAEIRLSPADVDALVAFLRALDEDYQ